MEIRNFVKRCLEDPSGYIKPLIIDPMHTLGTGLMNPSVYIHNNTLLCNIRHTNYTLYHSECKQFHHYWGPLQYVHPENDCTLTTVNYLAELSWNMDIVSVKKIDTSELDVKPIWDFVGLEDIRLFSWNNTLYGSGVRRDTTTNGTGRMELSELQIQQHTVKEVSRWRIPAPGDNLSYCEKNWMPVLDKPWHYIKWTNPTEVVQVNPVKNTCETVVLNESTYIPGYSDFRGGSQVIPWRGNYIALIHEVRLFNSELFRKDGKYYHRFIMWDRNFNLLKIGKLFNFIDADIEFCCGLAHKDDMFYATFGFQDNAAYILRFNEHILTEML